MIIRFSRRRESDSLRACRSVACRAQGLGTEASGDFWSSAVKHSASFHCKLDPMSAGGHGRDLLQYMRAREPYFPPSRAACCACNLCNARSRRVIANLVTRVAPFGHAVYSHAYPRLPDVKLSQGQKDWLRRMGSVTAGLIFS